jgi:hypothetical protein
LNETKYEDEVIEETFKNPIQTKENDEENIKQILELLHSQKKKRNPCNKNALCWSFFVCEMTMQM